MAMKRNQIEIFSVSFLDIISCAFAAILLIILISDNNESNSENNEGINEAGSLATLKSEYKKLYKLKLKLENEISEMLNIQINVKKDIEEKLKINDALESQLLAINNSIKSEVKTNKAIANNNGLSILSENVIFIIDTSGSMQTIWKKVYNQTVKILDKHPNLNGFQIINDNGYHLLSGYKNRWIQDSEIVRDRIKKILMNWNAISNSNPLEGIRSALKTYKNKSSSLSIYVFGDEFSQGNFEEALSEINALNQKDNKTFASINGVGFNSAYSTGRFHILMRNVALINNGTYFSFP